MLKINKNSLTLHTVGSGLIALFFATFMASGTIAENYTENMFVAPVFFLVLVLWIIGMLLLVLKKFRASVWIMWLSIPVGMGIAFPIEALL